MVSAVNALVCYGGRATGTFVVNMGAGQLHAILSAMRTIGLSSEESAHI